MFPSAEYEWIREVGNDEVIDHSCVDTELGKFNIEQNREEGE
jgi:hypothetical protein